MNKLFLLMAISFVVLPLTQASADLLCGEATFNCVDPATGELKIENKQPVRHCVFDTNLTRDALALKLAYYEMCASLKGLVSISDMNK